MAVGAKAKALTDAVRAYQSSAQAIVSRTERYDGSRGLVRRDVLSKQPNDCGERKRHP
jgi:hypothetical protein